MLALDDDMMTSGFKKKFFLVGGEAERLVYK